MILVNLIIDILIKTKYQYKVSDTRSKILYFNISSTVNDPTFSYYTQHLLHTTNGAHPPSL